MDTATVLAAMKGLQDQYQASNADAGSIPTMVKRQVGELFNYNKPLIEEAARLEGSAYDLPSRLVNDFKTNYGGMTSGASGGAQIQSILNRLGSTFGDVDVAKNLLSRRDAYLGDISENVMQGWNLRNQGLQNSFNMLTPQLSFLGSKEENERNRIFQADQAEKSRAAARAGGGGGGGVAEAYNYDGLDEFINMLTQGGTTKTTSTTPTSGYMTPDPNAKKKTVAVPAGVYSTPARNSSSVSTAYMTPANKYMTPARR